MHIIKVNISVMVVFFCFCCFSVSSGHAEFNPAAEPESIDRAIRSVKPALVKIYALTASYQAGREIKSETTGSERLFLRTVLSSPTIMWSDMPYG